MFGVTDRWTEKMDGWMHGWVIFEWMDDTYINFGWMDRWMDNF